MEETTAKPEPPGTPDDYQVRATRFTFALWLLFIVSGIMFHSKVSLLWQVVLSLATIFCGTMGLLLGQWFVIMTSDDRLAQPSFLLGILREVGVLVLNLSMLACFTMVIIALQY